jgi:CheY-like chemotaxis protein
VLAFAVTDTGIGIAAEKLELIFGAFQQADGTTSRGYGGTGLGLSISRDIARLLGGEIHATSHAGQGSTFTFFLPDRRPADAVDSASGSGGDWRAEFRSGSVRTEAAVSVSAGRLGAVRPGGPGGSGGSAGSGGSGVSAGLVGGVRSTGELAVLADDPLNGAKILIVDDDVRNVFALTSVIERYGAHVRYAENGRAGMDILQREDDIGLVLMDVMMPELDGYATMAAIRRRPEFADLPIITVTAKAMKGDRAKAIASGASEYVTKPVDIGQLIGLMRGWLERRPGGAGPVSSPVSGGSGGSRGSGGSGGEGR